MIKLERVARVPKHREDKRVLNVPLHWCRLRIRRPLLHRSWQAKISIRSRNTLELQHNALVHHLEFHTKPPTCIYAGIVFLCTVGSTNCFVVYPLSNHNFGLEWMPERHVLKVLILQEVLRYNVLFYLLLFYNVMSICLENEHTLINRTQRKSYRNSVLGKGERWWRKRGKASSWSSCTAVSTR